MSKEWFEQWFDTDFYHMLYEHRDSDEAAQFVTNLMDFLKLPMGTAIIDIACGRGRHAAQLNKMGFDVTGIDLSSKNIEFAKGQENDRLKFACHDKRKIYRKGGYDVALNLFTSFGYLRQKSDLEKALINMAGNLKVGGIFVMDFLNSHRVREMGSSNEKQSHKDFQFNINKYVDGDAIIKDIDVARNDEKWHFTEQVQLISKDEFQNMFERAELKIMHTFGDYFLNPFNLETSDRLILVAEKY